MTWRSHQVMGLLQLWHWLGMYRQDVMVQLTTRGVVAELGEVEWEESCRCQPYQLRDRVTILLISGLVLLEVRHCDGKAAKVSEGVAKMPKGVTCAGCADFFD